MNMDDLRQTVVKRLRGEADSKVNNSINLRSGSFSSVDQYAVAVSDLLSEARGLARAIEVIDIEFKKLSQPEKANQADDVAKAKPDREVY